VCKKSLRSYQAHVQKKSWLAECGSNDGRWVPKGNLSQRNTEAYPEISPFHLRFGCGSHVDRSCFNFLKYGGGIWLEKPPRRKWILYNILTKLEKRSLKVKEIIFISFHAEGVGTKRQSTVEGRFFSSPMRTWLPQISHSISQAKPQCSGWLGAAGEFPSSIRSPNPGEAGVKAGDLFRKL
jgi:hypothetical protein